jgi:hypothetical protein
MPFEEEFLDQLLLLFQFEFEVDLVPVSPAATVLNDVGLRIDVRHL